MVPGKISFYPSPCNKTACLDISNKWSLSVFFLNKRMKGQPMQIFQLAVISVSGCNIASISDLFISRLMYYLLQKTYTVPFN